MQTSGWIPQHIIACASGAPGTGKTMALTAVGYQEYLLGKKIFSTYKLNFPHEFVESKEQLYKMRNGVFLGDELWRWLFSRKAMYKEQQEILMDFIENIRKRGIDMVYAGHYDDSIDRVVREVTRYYVDTSIVPMQRPDMEIIKKKIGENGESEEIFKAIKMALTMPENYGVRVDIYKEIMPHEYEHINSLFFKNLRVWGSLFFTFKEVGQLKEKPTCERPGIPLERWFYNKLPPEYFILLPASGHGSGLPGEIKSIEPAEPVLIDVKGLVNQHGTQCIDIRSQKMAKYLDCYSKRRIRCYFGIKLDNKPYFAEISEESPFIKHKSYVAVSSLGKLLTKNQFLKKVIRVKVPIL